MGINNSVSFIIPHKGREEMLAQTLNSILEQICNYTSIEIIVVSQNKTVDLANELSFTDVKFILASDNLTISALRNIGAKSSISDYLAFLDADVQLSSNWLEAMLSSLNSDSQYKLVAAMQINDSNPPIMERIRTELTNVILDDVVDFLPGRNLFLSRDIFEQVGGFPEHLITCEDYFFTDKVNEIGLLYYTSSSSYIHLGEDKSYRQMFEKEVWRGQSNLKSLAGRSIPLREWPSFIAPILFACGPLLAGLAIFKGSNAILFTSLTFIFGTTLAYSFRLYFKARSKLPLMPIILFYAVYFPARVKGMSIGLFKSIKVNQ